MGRKTEFSGLGLLGMRMGFQPFMAVGWQFHEEMKTKFGQERDKEFASHVCAEHPKARKDHQ
jgi:hypothetical protein